MSNKGKVSPTLEDLAPRTPEQVIPDGRHKGGRQPAPNPLQHIYDESERLGDFVESDLPDTSDETIRQIRKLIARIYKRRNHRSPVLRFDTNRSVWQIKVRTWED